MKHKIFKVTFFDGFKQVGTSTAISMEKDGETIEEMTKSCKEKFPDINIKVEV